MLIAATEMGPPTAGWLFEVVGGLVWIGMLAWTVVTAVRAGTIRKTGLTFIAATSMFWQEWFCDWGVLLQYNEHFLLFPGWTSTWYQTPYKPVGVLFGYGWFFALSLTFTVWGARRLENAHQKWNRYVVQAVVTLLLFYTFDILIEFVMTQLDWYRYYSPAQPAIALGDAAISLVHPALLFMIFGVVVSLVLANPDERGVYWHERLFRVDRLSGWKREAGRVVAWVVFFNATLLISQLIPDVLGRIWFGSDNPFVPY